MMPKEVYHPNAYLPSFRNVKLGLKARSKILGFLDKLETADVNAISKNTGLPPHVILYHLKLLEAKGIVSRKRTRPSVWGVTGFGQKRLQ